MSAPGDDKGEKISILKDLIFNQYQAILLGGVAAASLITLNPLPLFFWVGGQLVLLPVLDSGPLRRLVVRRKLAASRQEQEDRRERQIKSFSPVNARRYGELLTLCRQIASNYGGLTGISQVYLTEQRSKLDMVLDGCVHRMTALQRYERLLASRSEAAIQKEISRLEQELQQPDLPDRARTALQKNIELQHKLLDAEVEARGTMKALSTELDSMSALLQVLLQNSISMRDPEAISNDLDAIVRQSEDSEKIVREMESLLRSGTENWQEPDIVPDRAPPARSEPASATRQRVRDRE